MDIMDTFPEWSDDNDDDDSSELDEFLSRPWPDENANSIRTNREGWPEFSPASNRQSSRQWRQFSPNQSSCSKIVSISAIDSNDDQGECRDDCHSRNEKKDVRDDDDEDDEESVLTLSSMAGATVELAMTAATAPARQTTAPNKPQLLLRQKLPMLLCNKSGERLLKQPSPGDKRVRFAIQHNNDNESGMDDPQLRQAHNADFADHQLELLDPIIEIGVDNATEIIKSSSLTSTPVVVTPPARVVPSRSYRSAVFVQQNKVSPSSSSFEQTLPSFQADDSAAPLEAYMGKCSPSNWIHNANLFHDKTLPSNTLDFFCRDSGLAATAGSNSVPSMRPVSYSEDTATVSSSSSSPSSSTIEGGISSLAGGAVDAKLAQVFSLTSIQEQEAAAPRAPRRPSVRGHRFVATKSGSAAPASDPPPTATPTIAPRRQHHCGDAPSYKSRSSAAQTRDPPPQKHVSIGVVSSPDMFNRHEDSASRSEVVGHDDRHGKFSHMPPLGTSVADRQKWLSEAFKRPQSNLLDDESSGAIPMSRVSRSIEKFGGRASSRPSAVQQKRQELERKLASEKQRPCFKTKWEGRPGSYKKKVVYSTTTH